MRHSVGIYFFLIPLVQVPSANLQPLEISRYKHSLLTCTLLYFRTYIQRFSKTVSSFPSLVVAPTVPVGSTAQQTSIQNIFSCRYQWSLQGVWLENLYLNSLYRESRPSLKSAESKMDTFRWVPSSPTFSICTWGVSFRVGCGRSSLEAWYVQNILFCHQDSSLTPLICKSKLVWGQLFLYFSAFRVSLGFLR